jgi:hypothetical protein
VLYELRIYQIKPGKLGDFVERYGKETGQMGAYKRAGFDLMCAWTDDIGTSNQFTYMLRWKDFADKEQKWPKLVADEAWAKERAATEADGPWLLGARNAYLRLTPYSPEPGITTNVQELRIYDAMPGKMGALNNRFANHTVGLFKKHGMSVIGFWTQEVGVSNELIYMLGFDSLSDREKSFASLSGDAEWAKVRAESEKDGALVRTIYNTILRPPAYLRPK